jgi:hypothetical protein
MGQAPDASLSPARERFAPLGAKKLYEAIKHKKVTDVTWVKV